MGLTGAVRGVVILQTSMPVAVLSYILALRYDNDPETLAGLVMQSTLLSMIVLPLLLLSLLP
jgi:malate permease and related proteins